MGPINLQVRYRPIRIGWCVREGDFEELRKALRLTHTFWGGRFNPIIPLGDPELTRLLIRTFRVDCLCCISESTEGKAVMEEFKHLLWPNFYNDLFVDYWGNGHKTAAFLDVYHPARRLYERNIEGRENPTCQGTLFRWDNADPLSDVFLATFGGYPTHGEIGKDYEGLFQEYLFARDIEIANGAVVLPTAFMEHSPSALTEFDPQPIGYASERAWPGLYYGQSRNFADLVNFWNLRASGIEVLFYDPSFRSRLGAITDHHLAVLRNRPRYPPDAPDEIAIWNKYWDESIDTSPFGPGVSHPSLSPASWNGAQIKPSLMGFEEKSVLGTHSDEGRISITFELPPKPFFDEAVFGGQKVVVSAHPLVPRENVVLKPPFFPRLNEYYGRQMHFEYNAARSEQEGIGIVTSATTSSLTIHALDVRSLVSEIFGAFGISASPSPAGLVGLRLIDQMGGLQGCRVFKIAGVRELICAYPPDRWFTRSCAVTMIRQLEPASGRPQFADYELLFIDGKRPKPEDAFLYLLKKGVFRPGLCFRCPNCELESWIHLDDARTINPCEYCGKAFNVTPQLRDRDWAYRRSGLFGRDDNQGGGIPVALTLMQLQTALRDHILAYTTGTDLKPATADIRECETDFVMIVESPREKTSQVAIGECKSDGGVIEADDVDKMARVADTLASKDCQVFIVFSKTSTFTSEEVERCKAAQRPQRRRAILFSRRELEPYHLYEQTSKEFEISPYASSLEQMARATHNVYFEPRPKAITVPLKTQ